MTLTPLVRKMMLEPCSIFSVCAKELTYKDSMLACFFLTVIFSWYSLQVFVETFQQLQHLILWIFLILYFIFKNIQGKHSGLLHTCLKQYSHA